MFASKTPAYLSVLTILTIILGVAYISPVFADDDFDCMVYICRNDYLNPIPSWLWNNDAYICENGGAMCESYPIPGAPPECPPVKICFFHSRGYWRNTYRCTDFYELGPYPPCPNGTVSHEITHYLHVGESTGMISETIVETGFGRRRGIICIDEPIGPTPYDCTIPDWFMDLLTEKTEDWEQNGYVETDSIWFECTEEGCNRCSFGTT